MFVTNPQNPTPQKIMTRNITAQKQSAMSLMPTGLLNRFKKDQVLDLIAYLLAAGKPGDPLFRK